MRLGPLRILHIANFNQFKYAAWYMNLDAKLSLGFSQLGQAVDRVIHDSNIGTVFLTYRNGIYYEEGGKLRDVFSASSFEKFTTSDLNNRGLSDTIQTLLDAGKTVVYLWDVPNLGFTERSCLPRTGKGEDWKPENCVISRKVALQLCNIDNIDHLFAFGILDKRTVNYPGDQMTAKAGPKTEKGKAIVAQNSLRHGLTAKGFISDSENAEHASLVQKLNEEYSPKGTIESILIEDLAMIRVQLARFKDVEAALFLNSQGEAELASSLVDSLQISDDRTRQDLINAINSEENFIDAKHHRESKWLSRLHESNIDDSELSEEIINIIKNELKMDCIERDIRPFELIEHLERQNTDPNAPLCIVRLIGVTPNSINLEKAERDSQLEHITELQMRDYVSAKKVDHSKMITKQKLLDRALSQKASLINAALPPPGELDRLYRYRTTLEKQFANKLSQLIQLQEMRERKERQQSRS